MKLIQDVDYFVRLLPYPLPPHFVAFVTPEVQRKALKHELEHLRCGHFDVGVDPVAAEEEAEKRCG